MSRVKFTTTLNEKLLIKAKEKAKMEGFSGANAVIEKALSMYFANCGVEVWHKLQDDCLQKLIIRNNKATLEVIKGRKVYSEEEVNNFSPEALSSKGFKNVWKMKTAN